MVVLKEDIDEAKNRLEAWWDHEIIDRPVISYYAPSSEVSIAAFIDIIFFNWYLAKNPDGIENAIINYEARAQELTYGGESIPSFIPYYGPGIIAAIFGVIPKFQTQTVWFSRPTSPNDIVALLENVKLNADNPWYSRLLKITEYAAKQSQDKYQVSITDLGGILDILSAFLGPKEVILTMKRRPDIINTCREILLEKTLKIYDDLQNIISKYNDGCNAWLNVWNKKRWYPIQCDFCAMLNPTWFKRFALPDIVTQAAHMDYSIYHLDGPNALVHLDDLLSIPELTGIQWVPGDGREPMGHEKWYPVYKKIQAAGKNIVNTVTPSRLSTMYRNFDPKGLFLRAVFFDKDFAGLYLPHFIGGDGGRIIEKGMEWAANKNMNPMSKTEFDSFLQNNEVQVENMNLKKLHQEINRKLKRKTRSTPSLS